MALSLVQASSVKKLEGSRLTCVRCNEQNNAGQRRSHI